MDEDHLSQSGHFSLIFGGRSEPGTRSRPRLARAYRYRELPQSRGGYDSTTHVSDCIPTVRSTILLRVRLR